ncbi:MAG: hypothetical protein P4L76_06990 [Beijerinckiaceae bacterium]|nr:hypothetical protein [Beijerinckiaceae bacterium]
MIKWALSLVINRLIVLAVILFAMNNFMRTSCAAGGSMRDQIEQILPGLKEISRALEDPR